MQNAIREADDDQADSRQGRGRSRVSRQALIGTFERTARFDTHLDEAGISLSLHRMGSEDVRKTVRMHFHFALFAEILHDLAMTVKTLLPADVAHREALRDAAKALYLALDPHTKKVG